MSDYVLTPAAKLDLIEIETYITSRDSARAALKVIDDIDAAFAKIAQMPGIGHVRPNLTNKPVKFWRVHSYLIVYRPDVQPVQIHRVISGHRDIGRLL